jgi:hypothetical protein
MARRMLKIAPQVSAVLCAVTVMIWVAGFWLDPRSHRISLGPHFHVSARTTGLDGEICFFSDEDLGPYGDVIINVSGPNGKTYPLLQSEHEFGRYCGIYYHYARWFNGNVLWTLQISLWYPFVVFGMLPAFWVIRTTFVIRANRQKRS